MCWRHAAAFTVAALPGIIGGTAVGDAVAGSALISGFALVMLLAAAATWRKASEQPAEDDAQRGHICPALRPGRDLGAGLVVGFLTGLFGVGGGFILVPTLAVVLAFSMRSAIGTSLAIITTTSMLGVIVHLAAGRSLDPGLTLAMGTACVAGALLGTRLSARVPQQTLSRAFAGLVVAVAGYLLLSAAFWVVRPLRPDPTNRKEPMHNVNIDALEQTISKAQSDPAGLKQQVTYDGEWQTDGGPQFISSIPVPNGEPVAFQADFRHRWAAPARRPTRWRTASGEVSRATR